MAAVALAVVGWWWFFVNPMPPNNLSITSAGKGGAYHQMAQRYAEVFLCLRVQLDVQVSKGLQENIDD